MGPSVKPMNYFSALQNLKVMDKKKLAVELASKSPRRPESFCLETLKSRETFRLVRGYAWTATEAADNSPIARMETSEWIQRSIL